MRNRPLAILPPSVRSCGNCRACCTHLPIPAGILGPQEKPAGVTCLHLGEHGCSVYSDRPRACVEFCCAWMQTARWPSRWRPDRLGLMCLREKLDGDLFASAVYEIRPGALESRAAKPILAALRASSAAVVLINAQCRRRCLLGTSSVDAAHAAPPAPHFRVVPGQDPPPPRVFPIRAPLHR